MSPVTYDLSVPVFVRALEQLLGYLKRGEQWADSEGKDKSTLIEGKLAPDMLPLPFQVFIATRTAQSVVAKLSGREVLTVENTDKSFPELYARIEKTLEFLRESKPETFSAPEDTYQLQVGPKEYGFVAADSVQRFALPNFFFHQTTAYAILRQAGVPLGKNDYLGFATLFN